MSDFQTPNKLANKTPIKNSVSNLITSKKLLRRVNYPSSYKITHKKKVSLPNVEERFYNYQKSSQSRIAERQRAKEEEELSFCTFKPQINGHSKKNRSFDQYYQDMAEFARVKDQKIKASKELKEASQKIFDFQPLICERSDKMSKSNPYCALPSHQRLFNQGKDVLHKGGRAEPKVETRDPTPKMSD